MHAPTIKKLAQKSMMRFDTGNSVMLTSGEWIVVVPNEHWPAELARFTGRSADQFCAKPGEKIEPDDSVGDKFRRVLEAARALPGEGIPEEASTLRRCDFHGYGVELVNCPGASKGKAVPLRNDDQWTLVDAEFHALFCKLGDVTYHPGTGKSWPEDPITLAIAGEAIGLVAPIRKLD